MSSNNRFTGSLNRNLNATFGGFIGAASVAAALTGTAVWGVSNDGTLGSYVKRIRVQLLTAVPTLLSLNPAQAAVAPLTSAKISSTNLVLVNAKAIQELTWGATPLEFVANGVKAFAYLQNQGDKVDIDFPDDSPLVVASTGQNAIYLWNRNVGASGGLAITVTLFE